MKPFTHIWLFGRLTSSAVPEIFKGICEFLIENDRQVYIESSLLEHFKPPESVHIIPEDTPPKAVDLLVVVGGDGSLLSGVHKALPHQLPVVGVHRGYLGFLTDINPEHPNTLLQVLDGEYQTETRELLQTHLTHADNTQAQLALNEVALLSGRSAELIRFNVYIDERFVSCQRADGLVVSTPTGSTAYALSAGGPIVHPGLPAITLVPLAPHTLSSRPLVIGSHQKIRIDICEGNDAALQVCCDSMTRFDAPLGAQLHIERHLNPLNLIHPKDYCYYNTLRDKLGWEKRAAEGIC